MKQKCDVLIFGANGMLGNTLLRYFNYRGAYKVIGTIRGNKKPKNILGANYKIINKINAYNIDSLNELINKYKPSFVINCIGIVKQLSTSNNPLLSITMNSLLPHQLLTMCDKVNAKLIHVSTDCVFNGKKGQYKEIDLSDATDLYGKTKFLGEVGYNDSITIRTSIIGHEVETCHGLIEWFLKQNDSIEGFTNAVFSGLPTVELARIIHDYVLPTNIKGLFHVSSAPISKFDLLSLVAEEYSKIIDIKINDKVVIDRSLNSSKFQKKTGFRPKSWQKMLKTMREFR